MSADPNADVPVSPALPNPLHVGRPNLGDRDSLFRRIQTMLDRKWLSNHGPLVQELEERLTALLGVRHCIVLCNGTVALEVAIRAMDLDGEVILPSFTFIASAHAVRWLGLKPVFADIDPDTCNLDATAVERLITPRTAAILGVHVYGRPCAVDRLQNLATRRGLTLFFDAAHAFGCSHQGRMIGNFGRCEVFSFHATKFFNTCEGGAIATNDDTLARRIRMMINFGFTGTDQVDSIGTNGKMTEICAAVGITNLEALETVIAANRRNYHAYAAGLAGIAGMSLLPYDEKETCNYQYVVVRIDARRFGMHRDHLAVRLREQNVLARRYFYPACHNMEPYRTMDPSAGGRLPVTSDVSEQVLALPSGTQADVNTVATVCHLIRSWWNHDARSVVL